MKFLCIAAHISNRIANNVHVSNIYRIFTPGGGLSSEEINFDLNRLLSKHNISIDHIKSVIKEDKPGTISSLFKHVDKYDPELYWEYIAPGANSLDFLKSYRRGRYKAPDHLTKLHSDFIIDEFEKVNQKTGSGATAKELSRIIPNREIEGIVTEGNEHYLVTFKSGVEVNRTIVDPEHPEERTEITPSYDPKDPSTRHLYKPEMGKEMREWIGDPYTPQKIVKLREPDPENPGEGKWTRQILDPWNK